MKKTSLLLLSGVALFAACESAEAEITDAIPEVEEELVIESDEDKISYMVGFQEANMMVQNGMGDVIEGESFSKGFMAAINGQESEVDVQEAMMLLQKITAAPFEENKVIGMDYLAENAKREGVKVLPSGLQYEIINEGDGKNPVDGEKCSVHYTGTFIDGTKFDSSYDRGEPYDVDIRGGVIPAWLEALRLMSKGSKWKIYCPFETAYGQQGKSPTIEPYTALVFEMEIMEIKK
jgi:FKBP-type peptidyl-prolyl cis-trans isomerase FklB